MLCRRVSYQSDVITVGCFALAMFMRFVLICCKGKAVAERYELAVAERYELEDRIFFIFTLKLLFIRAYANGFTAALHVSDE